MLITTSNQYLDIGLNEKYKEFMIIILIYCDSSVVILSFSFFIPLLYSVTPWVLVILWEKC